MVLIVGAGPTGLTLAHWLTRLRIPVRIIDKNDGAPPFSRALGVHARTLEFYRQLGFVDAVIDGGIKVQGINLWVKGKKRARVAFGQVGEGLTPFPYILDFAQDAHERLLIERLEGLGVGVERHAELLHFDQDAHAVRAALKRGDGTEELLRADYVAGCDGAHSTVRQIINAGFPGGTYSRLFYVADVDAGGPVADGEVHIDLDTGDDFLAVFGMKGPGHVRLVGTVLDQTAQRPELTLEDVGHVAIEHLKIEIAKLNWFSTYQVHHRVANSFRKGRAFLLGDAAHIHSPVGAQGMNTGIGDAVNLAWKLADVLQGRAGEDLLDSYEIERIRFARGLVATTDRAFTFLSKPGLMGGVLRTVLIPAILPLLLRLNPVRHFVFCTVSQIKINYRGSPLSQGAAGKIRGGDRLPWVPLGPSEDNFTPLQSLAWQVHVYGKASTALIETCGTHNISLHAFPWTPAMEAAGFINGATYVIRPDGYVALADATNNQALLLRYFRPTPAHVRFSSRISG